jgi:hypothetical protein
MIWWADRQLIESGKGEPLGRTGERVCFNRSRHHYLPAKGFSHPQRVRNPKSWISEYNQQSI